MVICDSQMVCECPLKYIKHQVSSLAQFSGGSGDKLTLLAARHPLSACFSGRSGETGQVDIREFRGYLHNKVRVYMYSSILVRMKFNKSYVMAWITGQIMELKQH